MHRLRAAVQVTVTNDLAEGSNLLGLVAGRHGQVGAPPVAEDSEALETDALQVDLRVRKRTAGGPKCGGIELLAGLAVFFLDRELDRQAVAVPAGEVRGVEGVPRVRFDDGV